MKTRPERKRISRLKRLMARDGVTALFITRREDVRYLSGFTGSAGALLVTTGKPSLITDFRYQLQAGRQCAGVASVVIQKKDLYSALRDVADRVHAETVWFDESSLSIEDVKKMKRNGLRTREHRDFIRTLRMCKDAHEAKNIRTAVKRAETSFRELTARIKPGVTERDLGIALEYLMREKGSRKAAFDTIVASGPNGAMPHATTSNRRIRRGDLITIDFGAEAEGYFCDVTRTVCVGRPSPRQREIHDLVLSAQAAAMRSVKPGVSGKFIDNEAREIIRRAGHAEHFGHGTGHGIGLMVHEGPSISPLSKDEVERDMVFTIEPGVYIPGWGGVRIEDMVFVNGRECEVLTTLPRSLEMIRVR